MSEQHRWRLRCEVPTDLVQPAPVDPTGKEGPTKGQARGPNWRRTSHALYVPADAPPCVEQRILEMSRRLQPGGVVSGWAALRLAGGNLFDGLGRDGLTPLPVPLLLPAGARMRRGAGYEPRRDVLAPDEISTRAGIPVTTPYRATLDAMCWAPDMREAVVVADMALAAGLVEMAALVAYIKNVARRPGIIQARHAVMFAVERSRSPAESRMRLIWEIDAGLPRPLCNWPVADLTGARIGRPDILIESVAVVGEFDGRDHRSKRAQAADVAKDSEYRNAGLEVFRLVGDDINDTALAVRRMSDAVRRAEEADRPRRWLRCVHPGPL